MHRKAFAVEFLAKKVLSRESRIESAAIYILAVHKETFDLLGIKFENNRNQVYRYWQKQFNRVEVTMENESKNRLGLISSVWHKEM